MFTSSTYAQVPTAGSGTAGSGGVQPTQTNSNSSSTRPPDCFVYGIVKSNSWSAVTYKMKEMKKRIQLERTTTQHHREGESIRNRFTLCVCVRIAFSLWRPTENSSTHTHRWNASRSHIPHHHHLPSPNIFTCYILNVFGDDAIRFGRNSLVPNRLHGVYLWQNISIQSA